MRFLLCHVRKRNEQRAIIWADNQRCDKTIAREILLPPKMGHGYFSIQLDWQNTKGECYTKEPYYATDDVAHSLLFTEKCIEAILLQNSKRVCTHTRDLCSYQFIYDY